MTSVWVRTCVVCVSERTEHMFGWASNICSSVNIQWVLWFSPVPHHVIIISCDNTTRVSRKCQAFGSSLSARFFCSTFFFKKGWRHEHSDKHWHLISCCFSFLRRIFCASATSIAISCTRREEFGRMQNVLIRLHKLSSYSLLVSSFRNPFSLHFCVLVSPTILSLCDWT